MFEGFLITFREGLEAFLLVGIMLSYLERVNATRYSRYLYCGVAAGVVVSLGVAFAFQVLISQFENEYYERCLMIFILLFASAVLAYMAIWMQRQARGKASSVQRQLEAHIDAKNLAGMVSLSFVAVLREGFETVLFFSALTYAGGAELTLGAGVTGGLLGLAASMALVYALLRGTRRVPLTPFFKYSGLLIIIIAAGLFSSAVNQMQAIEWLPILIDRVFDISLLLDDSRGVGIFLRALFGYNASPTLLTFLAWAIFLGTFVLFWRRTYAPAPAPVPATA